MAKVSSRFKIGSTLEEMQAQKARAEEIVAKHGSAGEGGARLALINKSIAGLQRGQTPPTDLGINKKTGQIDPNKAVGAVTGAVADDTNRTFNMQNPGSQTDVYGNTQNITRDPATGQVIINQTGGAGLTAANQAFTGALSDFSQNGQSAAMAAQNANFNYLTRNDAKAKADEIAAAKQELSQRGIPINPDPNSLYGKTLAQIDQKYQTLTDQANNQAILTGNQTLATRSGVIGTLGQTLQGQSPTFTAYQGGQSNQGGALSELLKTISGADMAKYGIDQDTMTKLKQIAAQKETAAAALAASKAKSSGSSGPNFNNGAPA